MPTSTATRNGAWVAGGGLQPGLSTALRFVLITQHTHGYRNTNQLWWHGIQAGFGMLAGIRLRRRFLLKLFAGP